MNKDVNKPNKKQEILGLVICIIGIIMMLLPLFGPENGKFLVIGIFVLIIGLTNVSIGKLGFEKTIEAGMSLEKFKAKEIAKGIKEGLDEDKSKDAE